MTGSNEVNLNESKVTPIWVIFIFMFWCVASSDYVMRGVVDVGL